MPPALDHNALAALYRQQAILRADQDWQVEREAYLIRGRAPTKTGAIWISAVFLVLGLVATCNSASVPGLFLPISLVTLAAAGGVGGYWWYKANVYEAAEAQYFDRRDQVARRAP